MGKQQNEIVGKSSYGERWVRIRVGILAINSKSGGIKNGFIFKTKRGQSC